MYCKNCGAQFDGEEKFCGKCGVLKGNGDAFCAHCGKPIKVGNTFCTYCGDTISDDEVVLKKCSEEEGNKKQKPEKVKKEKPPKEKKVKEPKDKKEGNFLGRLTKLFKGKLKHVTISVLVIVVIVSVVVFTLTYLFADVTIDGVTYARNSDGGYTVSDCKNDITVVEIPSTVRGKPVTSIGGYAFEDCTSLTSVTIGSGVTSIGDCAFWICTNLTDVYYEGSATDWGNVSIGDYIDSLTSATIYYYVEDESDVPTDGGNYWHYVGSVPTVWATN